MKRRRKFILLVVLTLAAGAGIYWWRSQTGAVINEGHARLYGHIEMRQARLAFKEQERIIAVLVEEGDRVTPGQVVARLDTGRLEAQILRVQAQTAARQETFNRLLAGTRPLAIEQARAEVAAARVQVANAQRSYARIQQTAGAGISTEQALDDTKSALDVAKARLDIQQKALQLAEEGARTEEIAEARHWVEAGRAELSLLKIRLADMTLCSPVAGVVRNRILEPGEMADPGRPVIIVALIDPKWVRAYAPEPMLGHLKPGMAARVISDTFTESYDGWIGFISPEAEFTPKNVQTTELRTKLVYEVRIRVHDPENQLRLGMPVTVEPAFRSVPTSR
ncbi:MAG: HlyD family efflux transporter periplasmic adaptor subunit [Desulfatitalea sp.]|nr:HlyD family efflux transporter periplasmic adaptor subunit [Desulfatitalea sp.]NNK00054.1 HlyD family efflux transporter periplasmic adaptor subunit [Desulfatitalea sp.]